MQPISARSWYSQSWDLEKQSFPAAVESISKPKPHFIPIPATNATHMHFQHHSWNRTVTKGRGMIASIELHASFVLQARWHPSYWASSSAPTRVMMMWG